MSRTLRIGLTGGGSGGHVYPLIAVSEALEKISNQNGSFVELYYFGPSDQYGALMSAAGARMRSIASSKIRRYFSLANLIDIPKFFIGILQALWKLFWVMPDVLFSKGGPGALPVVFVAWFYRIPVIIHESDAAPGTTNLISAKFAQRVAVSFDRSSNYFDPRKTAVTGNPLRADLSAIDADKTTAKQQLGFDPSKPLILVLGGSQGSKRINEFILTVLGNLLNLTQVMHQTGTTNYMETVNLSKAALSEAGPSALQYKPVAYLEKELRLALAAADLVVARAGSGTIFEIAANKKPSILIPLMEAANDHQRINAYEFSAKGAAVVIEEPNLLPEVFIGQVSNLLQNTETLDRMSVAAGEFAKLQAAEEIAKEIISLT